MFKKFKPILDNNLQWDGSNHLLIGHSGDKAYFGVESDGQVTSLSLITSDNNDNIRKNPLAKFKDIHIAKESAQFFFNLMNSNNTAMLNEEMKRLSCIDHLSDCNNSDEIRAALNQIMALNDKHESLWFTVKTQTAVIFVMAILLVGFIAAFIFQ